MQWIDKLEPEEPAQGEADRRREEEAEEAEYEERLRMITKGWI